MGKPIKQPGTISKTVNNVDYFLHVNASYTNPSYKDWFESGEVSELDDIEIIKMFANDIEVKEEDIDNIIIEELLDDPDINF